MSDSRGPASVRAAFRRARSEGRAAFIAYVMAGYPDGPLALAACRAALDAGADLLEIGVPFSDPVADGPVIADAGRQALERGGGLEDATALIARLREHDYPQPILAMSYLNPLVVRGRREALTALATSGVDGLIVPDLPAGEDAQFERMAAECGLALCFLVAPNAAPDRIERAAAASTGFLYVVPLLGVTGARDRLADGAIPFVERVRAAAGSVPVAAGFGVSSAEQVRSLASAADGVVVGSALVAELGDGVDGPGRLGERVRELTAGLPHA